MDFIIWEDIVKGQDAYQRFTRNLKCENRFFVEKEFQDIFDAIIEECEYDIPQNMSLYRARIYDNSKKKDEETGKIKGEDIPYNDNDIGIPPTNIIPPSGRINSKGINCFYLADDKETAIAEVRPNIDSYVTIGTFKTERSLKVIKLSSKMSNCYNNKDSVVQGNFSRTFIMSFLSNLQIEFFCPIAENDRDIKYLPMQYFSQYCKYKNFDGIIFPSSVMEQYERTKSHYNYTFFKDTNIRWVDSELFRVREISYKFIQVKR